MPTSDTPRNDAPPGAGVPAVRAVPAKPVAPGAAPTTAHGEARAQVWALLHSLGPAERAKLRRLGGEHWLRAQLARAPEPPDVPAGVTALDFLRAIEHAAMPLVAQSCEAVWQVEELGKAGLVEAVVHLADAPEHDTATVLCITDSGRDALEAGTRWVEP